MPLSSSPDSVHSPHSIIHSILRRRSCTRHRDTASPTDKAVLHPHSDSDTNTSPSQVSPSNTGALRGDPHAQSEGRPDTPPDGEDLVAEWREGRDLVIETRNAPGDDVDVIVIRGGAARQPGEVEQRIRNLKHKLVRRKSQTASGVRGGELSCTGGHALRD